MGEEARAKKSAPLLFKGDKNYYTMTVKLQNKDIWQIGKCYLRKALEIDNFRYEWVGVIEISVEVLSAKFHF